jgi:hypothetical protein
MFDENWLKEYQRRQKQYIADAKKKNESAQQSQDYIIDSYNSTYNLRNSIKLDKCDTAKTKSKYGAIKTEIDGIKFDSKKESDYYLDLKLRLTAGDIKGFCRQAQFILAPGLSYKADFIVFNNDNTAEIIDVKGYITEVYDVKRKVFNDKFNLEIKEV